MNCDTDGNPYPDVPIDIDFPMNGSFGWFNYRDTRPQHLKAAGDWVGFPSILLPEPICCILVLWLFLVGALALAGAHRPVTDYSAIIFVALHLPAIIYYQMVNLTGLFKIGMTYSRRQRLFETNNKAERYRIYHETLAKFEAIYGSEAEKHLRYAKLGKLAEREKAKAMARFAVEQQS